MGIKKVKTKKKRIMGIVGISIGAVLLMIIVFFLAGFRLFHSTYYGINIPLPFPSRDVTAQGLGVKYYETYGSKEKTEAFFQKYCAKQQRGFGRQNVVSYLVRNKKGAVVFDYFLVELENNGTRIIISYDIYEEGENFWPYPEAKD